MAESARRPNRRNSVEKQRKNSFLTFIVKVLLVVLALVAESARRPNRRNGRKQKRRQQRLTNHWLLSSGSVGSSSTSGREG